MLMHAGTSEVTSFLALLDNIDTGGGKSEGDGGVGKGEEGEGGTKVDERKARWNSNRECVQTVAEYCEAVLDDAGGRLSFRCVYVCICMCVCIYVCVHI